MNKEQLKEFWSWFNEKTRTLKQKTKFVYSPEFYEGKLAGMNDVAKKIEELTSKKT